MSENHAFGCIIRDYYWMVLPKTEGPPFLIRHCADCPPRKENFGFGFISPEILGCSCFPCQAETGIWLCCFINVCIPGTINYPNTGPSHGIYQYFSVGTDIQMYLQQIPCDESHTLERVAEANASFSELSQGKAALCLCFILFSHNQYGAIQDGQYWLYSRFSKLFYALLL